MSHDDVTEEGRIHFRTVLHADERDSAGYVMPPFDVMEVFGSNGQIPVRGSINGAPYRSTLMPRHDGHWLYLNTTLRELAGAPKIGEEVDVEMEFDAQPREVEFPDDLLSALAEVPAASRAWERFSYAHQREWVLFLMESKTPEARSQRVAQMVEKLADAR